MTLREAVERVERFVNVTFPPPEDASAFKLLLDTARERLDDTAEIVLPCRTCGGKGEVVGYIWNDGTAAVSPCPTCSHKPVEVKS